MSKIIQLGRWFNDNKLLPKSNPRFHMGEGENKLQDTLWVKRESNGGLGHEISEGNKTRGYLCDTDKESGCIRPMSQEFM